MPRLHARHRTEIRYAGPVGESVNEVRLTPRADGRQDVEWRHLRVQPGAELAGHRDAFGNEVRWFQLTEPHETLVVESEAIVVTRPPAPARAGAGAAALADPGYRDAHAEFLAPSPHVRPSAALEEFARGLALGGDDVLGWARALEGGVNAAIVYEPGVTAVDTPVEEVVRVGRGVCQDMAHLMIACARQRGLAARYVSGWLHLPGHQGPGESHAWVEVAIPGAGWVEFDPTHPEPAHEHYVRVAVGRDYGDVPPLRGSYLGPPTEAMTVTVDVRLLPG
ncbi:transglutaminase family protein [Miltoncostaea marina]|uniref:transglutaminase family protein n=1 Tax=Miltoncostaea marina TaxID=2843215 RepID=UPI001C3DB858|nr:transglutaminase family protein [Miltoncostaea marina]